MAADGAAGGESREAEAMNSQRIRAAARGLLRGRFSAALAVTLIIWALFALAIIVFDSALFLTGVADYETGMIDVVDFSYSGLSIALFILTVAVAWLFLAMPLRLGSARWFFALADMGYPSVDCLFYAFGKGQYKRALAFNARMFLMKFLWRLLCCAPGILVSGAGAVLGRGDMALMVYDLGVMLFTFGLVLSGFICQRYFLARYIFTSSSEVTGKEALRISVEMMKGRKASLTALVFGFTGWFLLTVPTVGISLIYVMPYYSASLGIFAKGAVDTSLAEKRYAESEAANTAPAADAPI